MVQEILEIGLIGKHVVVTTDKDHRGVFFGVLEEVRETDVYTGNVMKEVSLSSARMVIRWSSETKGVLGLASIGPQKGSRISPPVPKIMIRAVSLIAECTKEAIEQFEKGIWE